MILKAFLKHEILNLLKSRRIYLTVFMFLVLYVSVFVVRVTDYQKQINQYLADVQQADAVMQNPANYSYINPRAIHQPLIFSIYNQGFRFNRVINIEFYEPISNSITQNEERNPLYYENNQLDITFLITFFLSLFILLISYDSVNGEKKTGTLRLLLTFPIKRQSFVLKKILGVFIFVAVTFSIPYILSILCLVLIYANMLTGSFFLSAFFYWFLVMLFIFFFSLMGIFVSVCTMAPSRSLVFSLLVWILFCIVLPISWDYLVSPKLYEDRLKQLQRIHLNKANQANSIFYDVPDEVNINHVSHMSWNNYFYSTIVWSFQETYDRHYAFQRYVYEKYYPVAREVEMARDDVLRKQINIDKTKSMVFFFNPIVLFNDISMKIAGNGRDDYLNFLHKGREIRDDLVNRGITEGWLLDYRFLARFEDENMLGSQMIWWEKASVSGWEPAYQEMLNLATNANLFKFEMPVIRRYDQPNPSFGEIFNRIVMVLTMFVVSIIILWIVTWYKFMRYDVR